MSIASTRSSSLSELAFFTNYILRNVVPCTTIGNVHDGSGGVRSWSEKNGFKPVFDFSTQQLFKIDRRSLPHPDVVVAHNPFSECVQAVDLTPVVEILDVAQRCIIVSTPTTEHHDRRPKVVATVKRWCENFKQLGTTVEIRHSQEHSIFLILK